MTEEPLKTNRTLYATGFLQNFSDELIKRFINLLAIAVGATVDQLGTLNATRMLASNLFQVLFGRLADRYGKKRLIAIGRILNGLTLAAILLVDTPGWVVSLVIAASIFTSMATPSWNSLLGDYTSKTKRGEVIGRVNSVSYIGGLIAMITAFLISVNQFGPITRASYTPVMVIASTASLIAGVTSLFLKEQESKAGETLDLKEVLRNPDLKRFLGLVFIYHVGSSVGMPLFPYIMAAKLQLSVWQVAVTSITNMLAAVLSQPYVGKLLDRLGRKKILAFSRMAMASSCLIYPVATSWVHIAAVEAISGLAISSWLSAQSTYMIDIAPRKLRATYLASSMASIGVATFIGSNIGGQLVQNVLGGNLAAVETGLYIAGALRLVLGLLFLTIKEKRG
ncbi:MFS transporter [Candidatus Bathyarchaeota archaeon]|jgi:MFS transporter, DHA1 family, multidrug resistance protein|nr:MFS transporter [Candidatus Bathyarchaeota archaeon]MBT4320867.1 MFS transporter [Candidatus Bathyarchaeota archaeon]MBT4423140.1 MFS transporter [Candidatus Bathyarchaeota archaeon]MBT6605996.1 MFS transporter [Candidatus Bathyarchaeota archaeon]MBT7187235.1 MFS transporter [Candidatus Bathyarchaeota archaeon]